MVVDGKEGLTASDSEILSWLRRNFPRKPVLLAVNKCENVQKADLQVSAGALRRVCTHPTPPGGGWPVCCTTQHNLWQSNGQHEEELTFCKEFRR